MAFNPLLVVPTTKLELVEHGGKFNQTTQLRIHLPSGKFVDVPVAYDHATEALTRAKIIEGDI